MLVPGGRYFLTFLDDFRVLSWDLDNIRSEPSVLIAPPRLDRDSILISTADDETPMPGHLTVMLETVVRLAWLSCMYVIATLAH